MECVVCEGAGHCLFCGGKGEYEDGRICSHCGGSGQCPECGDSGVFEITECPLKWIDHETRQFIELAELYLEHGLPPVAGGSLDQTVSFLDGTLFIRGETNCWKRQLGIIDG
jgi:hypothetical protein